MNGLSKPVMFSGIQPSGHLCIGNYIGALSNWIKLQEEYDCLFAVVDLHTITVRQDPVDLLQRSYEFTALYLACGIEPSKVTIFIQSHVPAHSQLSWILSCFTQFGELRRMTQFKEKSQKHPDDVNAGLFNYPVLMAADILLYNTNWVPVGDDQKQHVEITRDIAQRFNHIYGDVFTIPEPYIPDIGARIMSLQDPTSKMSKSDSNLNNLIGLLDPPDTIRKKFATAITDSGREIVFDKVAKPGISNLLTIFSSVAGESLQTLQEQYEGKGYAAFKKDLAEATIEFLKPIRDKYERILNNRNELTQILTDGAEKARERAKGMVDKVHRCMGFMPQS